MDCILFSEIVFVDQGDGIIVLLRKFAFSWCFLFLFHEIHTKEDATVASDQVVEVFACTYAHVVYVGTYYIRFILRYMGGFGMAKLGFCIQ